MSSILCVDNEPAVAVVLERSLQQLGHDPVIAASVREALDAAERRHFDLIISDYRMPDASGLELIESLRSLSVDTPVIIMTGYGSIEDAVLSMRRGAVDYLTKPLRQEALRLAVTNAIEIGRLRRENDDFRRKLSDLEGSRPIVGDSRALRAVMEVIDAVAPTRATVLLEGETGTGKELFARAIHERSPRCDRALVTLNCAALPEGLVESRMFGHERGAFTGATARTIGAFERADGGTLLLDEISEMGLDLQSKVLRALQEQEFERVGGGEPIKVDVRVIATTNRDLATEVSAGRFRRDLYFRISVVPIRTPPLRERMEDLPLLVAHFVERTASELGIRVPEVSPAAIDALSRRTWPGNIRELANAIERAVILSRSGQLGPSSFELDKAPLALPPLAAEVAERVEVPIGAERFNLDVLRKSTIEKALVAAGGRRTLAANWLGISERTLRNFLNRGTDPAD
jgi:DNA-binding NtrC family response regulator